MSFASFSRSVFRLSGSRAAHSLRPVFYRPSVEQLENRCLLSGGSDPSTVATGMADGFNPAAWPMPGSGWDFLARHAQNLAATRAGDPQLVFLGDSLTEQWSEGDARGAGSWRAYFARFQALDLGIAGNTTSQVLWQLQQGELNGLGPRDVVLMVGTNNVYLGQTAEQVAGGIAAVVQQVRADLPEAKILLLGILPRGQAPNPLRATISQVNERIAQLDDGEYVHYLDAGSAFLNKDQTISRDIMWDYLHLTGKGYHLLGQVIVAALHLPPARPEPTAVPGPDAESRAESPTPSTRAVALLLFDPQGEAVLSKGVASAPEGPALKAPFDQIFASHHGTEGPGAAGFLASNRFLPASAGSSQAYPGASNALPAVVGGLRPGWLDVDALGSGLACFA
jgi:beta-glucosidase